MARLISLALIVSLLPSGLAGPACAQKHKTAADCMAKCNTKWGFPGLMMGTDPWGTVMHNTGSSVTDWNDYLAKACAMAQEDASSSAAGAVSTSAGTVAPTLVHGLATQTVGAVEGAPSVASTSTSASSSSTTHSTTSTTTSRFTTSTRTSTTTKPTTTSTSTKPKPTTTSTTQQAAPTTHTTAQAPKNTQSSNTNTQSSNSNSNSNTNSNSNSGSSNSGSSSSGSGSRASAADQQAYLDAHNSIRSQHGAVPVTWSNDAAAKAQEWADKCTNQHSGGTLGPLGENLAAGTGSFSIAQAVKAWTDEVSEYNPSNPQPSHFTQVVWKATTEIGCAVQTCDGIFAGFGAAQYYVCEYSVQGNVIGNFAANVQV